jgi:hypothetical protein
LALTIAHLILVYFLVVSSAFVVLDSILENFVPLLHYYSLILDIWQIAENMFSLQKLDLTNFLFSGV